MNPRARALLEQRSYRQAAHLLLRRLVVTPDDALAHHELGRAYAGLGLTTAARRQFAEAVRLDPENAAFHAALVGVQRNNTTEEAHVARSVHDSVSRLP